MVKNLVQYIIIQKDLGTLGKISPHHQVTVMNLATWAQLGKVLLHSSSLPLHPEV